MDILTIDNVSGILSSLTYEGVLAFSKTMKLNKQNVYEAIKRKDVAESIVINELELTLDEIDLHPVDWIRVISVGVRNNVADLVYLTYQQNFKDFFVWYVMKKMTETQKTELLTFLIHANELDALKLVGGIVNFDILYNRVLMGYKELVITILEQIHTKISGYNSNPDELKDFVVKLLEGRIDYRRRAFAALYAKDIIPLPKYTHAGAKHVNLYNNVAGIVEISTVGMWDLLVPIYELTSYTDKKIFELIQDGSLLPTVAYKIFIERPSIVVKLLTDYEEIRENPVQVSLFVSKYSQNSKMMNILIDVVPIRILETVDLPEKYRKLLEEKKMVKYNSMVINSRDALVDGELDNLVANFTSLADIRGLVPMVTKPEILSFLKMKGFRLGMLTDREIITMIDNLPDYVALFNIFNDDDNVARSLLRNHSDHLTTDDILRLGFPLSEMLKVLEIEDSGDSETMLSELMYSDGPENIKEAAMAKLLS